MKLYAYVAENDLLRGVDEHGRWYTGHSEADFECVFPPAEITKLVMINDLQEFRRIRRRIFTTSHVVHLFVRTDTSTKAVTWDNREFTGNGERLERWLSHLGPHSCIQHTTHKEWHRQRTAIDERCGFRRLREPEFLLRHREQKAQRLHLSRRLKEPVRQAFEESDATFTRKVLKRLEAQGGMGRIGAALFRAQKASSRAKKYRGDYTDYSYERKGLALEHVCGLLSQQEELPWGWGRNDTNQYAPEHILYIDLPHGQVSFHSLERFIGTDYSKSWDGTNLSGERIIAFCESLLKEHFEDKTHK